MLRILSAIVVVLVPATAQASEFCRGFEQGYAAGYKRASGSPNGRTPPCPAPPARDARGQPADLDAGYRVGLKQGTAEGVPSPE